MLRMSMVDGNSAGIIMECELEGEAQHSCHSFSRYSTAAPAILNALSGSYPRQSDERWRSRAQPMSYLLYSSTQRLSILMPSSNGGVPRIWPTSPAPVVLVRHLIVCSSSLT